MQFFIKFRLIIFSKFFRFGSEQYVSVSSGEMCIKGRGSDSPAAHVSANKRSVMRPSGQSEARISAPSGYQS